MKKIIFSIIGVALFLVFSYFVFHVLSSAFSSPAGWSGSSTTTSLVGGDVGGVGFLVRGFVEGLNGSDSLKDGASVCVGLGSKGDYVVKRVGGEFVVFSGVGECDVVVGVNGDYLYDLEFSGDRCAVLRSYYDNNPKLAWVTRVNNVGNACSLGYVDFYEECFGVEPEEKEVIDAVCAAA